MANIGFFHDNNLKLGEASSENVSDSKSGVDVETVNISDGEVAEFSLVDYDLNEDLDSSNGMTIKNISSGPLKDKHSNYRSKFDVQDDFSLGVARFSMQDHVDTSDEKSRDEYWAQSHFDKITPLGGGFSLTDAYHSDGTVLMRAETGNVVSDEITIYSFTRDEDTKTWGASTVVDTVYVNWDSSNYVNPHPTFLTIPDVGTILFYFGLNRDASLSGHKYQYVYMSITKDHGVTWESYGEFLLDPFYGQVLMPQEEYPYAYEDSAVLKAAFYNNKIVLGMVLQGATDKTQKYEQIIGEGTSGTTDSFSDILYIQKGLSIKPETLTVTDSGGQVAADDGAGVISGTNVVGTIDYDTGEVTVAEDGANIWDTGEDCTVLYRLDGLYFYRIINLVISDDHGKTWTTVPQEFISSSLESDPPETELYLWGEPSSAASEYSPNAIPANFGLGYDIHSDKFVLANKSAGSYDPSSPYYPRHFDNISRLYFYYNVYDDLLDWGASVVDSKCYKLIDAFSKVSIENDYDSFDYSSATASNWAASAGELIETSGIEGNNTYAPTAAYFAGQARGGTHLIRLDEDPTMKRTVGIRADIKIGNTNTFGLGFCRQDYDNFYCVTFDCANNASSSGGTVTVYVKRVLAGTETTISTTTFVDFPQNSFATLTIWFADDDKINVALNDMWLTSVADNNLYEGNIFFLSNKSTSSYFDNLGLVTSTNFLNLPGSSFTETTIPYEEAARIGTNIEIATDQFGQSWIAADVSNLNVDNNTDNFFSHGITMQKFRLDRDIDRVEGDVLAKDKMLVKFNDSADFQQDVGYYFCSHEWSIFPIHATSSATKRPFLGNLVWHKDDPIFALRRQHSPTGELFILAHRDKEINVTGNPSDAYSNNNLFSNLNSYWHAFTADVDPADSGFEKDGGFTYTTVDDYIIRVTENNLGYFMQKYDFTTGTPNTNALSSIPVRYFDYHKRGMTAFFSTRSYSLNTNSTNRTVFECVMPRIDSGGTTNETKFRIICYENTLPTNGYYDIESYNGSSWISVGSITSIDVKQWREFAIHILPVEAAFNPGLNKPELYIYTRSEGTTEWDKIVEFNLYTYATPANIISYVKWGCFDGSGSPTSQQEFKICGYGDTCLISPEFHILRGETLQSGESIRATKGIRYSLSGGLSIKDDEWKLTDTSRRAHSKENLLLRPSAYWESDDDSSDKYVFFDAKHMLEYDTVIIYGINNNTVTFNYSDTGSFIGGNEVDIDLVKHNHLEYEKYSTTVKKDILRLLGIVPSFKQNEFIGQRLIGEDAGAGSFRIRYNDTRYFVIERDDSHIMPVTSSAYLDILSDRVAIKFPTRRRNRYFQIKCKTGTSSYPTPEGKFQIGQIAIGVFDEFAWNPEYPEVKKKTRTADVITLAGGAKRTNRRGPSKLQRTLNFNGVDSDAFGQQIRHMWLHSEIINPVFYVPNIEEYSTTEYTYTYDLIACINPPTLEYPRTHGDLSSVRLVLEENI